jgi:hypothetical protein
LNARLFIAVLLLSLFSATAVRPQGQLILDNRVGGVLVAPIYGPAPSDPELSLQGNTAAGVPAGTQVYPGALLAGLDYSAQLFAGDTNTATDELQPVTPIVHFRGGIMAGFWQAPELAVTIPGVPEGVPAKVQLRAWFNEGNRFSDWNVVRTNRWIARGVSLPFVTPPLGRSIILPPNLLGLRSFNLSIPVGVASLLPPTPSGLAAETTGDTSIQLSWPAMPASVQGYRIEHSLDGLSFPDAFVLAVNTTAYQVLNLKSGVRHHFRIRALNETGESAPSNVAVAQTRTPFAQWRVTHFPPADATNDVLSGPAADPDRDDLQNYGEYAFGSDPHTPDRSGLITSLLDRSDHPADVLAVTYARNPRATDAVIRARTAFAFDGTLAQSSNYLAPIILTETPTQRIETIRDNVPTTSASQRAMQLEVVNVGLRDVWQTLPDLPVALEGAGGGVIAGQLFVVGGGNNSTLRYDFSSKQWTTLPEPRPFPSAYHAVEVIDQRLYVIGGVTPAAAGKVQIYDPATNGWSLGPSVPYRFGLAATAVIENQLYVTAPDPNNPLRNVLARFNVSDQRWTTNLPGLPQARARAATGTDGTYFFVIGGRAPSGSNNDGSDTMQVYDPTAYLWRSSADPTSGLAALPQARSGLGKAIFWEGRLFVIGGETTFGFGATAAGTYNRVDIYRVAFNDWAKGTPMLTARHGYAAVLHEGRIYVAGGGTIAGSSASTTFEVYSP